MCHLRGRLSHVRAAPRAILINASHFFLRCHRFGGKCVKCQGDPRWAAGFTFAIALVIFGGFFSFLDWWLDNDVLSINEEVAAEALSGATATEIDDVERSCKSFNRLKILVSFMQILATLQTVYSVPWPKVLLNFFDWVDLIYLDFLDMPTLSLDCWMHYDFYKTWYITVIGPLILIGVMVLCFKFKERIRMDRIHLIASGRVEAADWYKQPSVPIFVHPVAWVGPYLFTEARMRQFPRVQSFINKAVHPRSQAIKNASEAQLGRETEKELGRFQTRCWQSVIWVIYTIYPAVARTCFKLLNCREFDTDEFYLVGDFRVRCEPWGRVRYAGDKWYGKYGWTRVAGVCFVVVYAFGIPIVLALMIDYSFKGNLIARIRKAVTGKHERADRRFRIRRSDSMVVDDDGTVHRGLSRIHASRRDSHVDSNSLISPSSSLSPGSVDGTDEESFEFKTIASPSGPLTHHSEKGMYQDRWKARLRFMHQGYRPGCEYFEVWELIRKAMLAGGMVFVYPESATQLYTGVLCTFISLAVHVSWRPFRGGTVKRVKPSVNSPIDFFKQCVRDLGASENSQQSIALAVLWFDLFIGYSIKVDTAGEDKWNSASLSRMAIFVLLVNACVICMEPALALLDFIDAPPMDSTAYRWQMGAALPRRLAALRADGAAEHPETSDADGAHQQRSSAGEAPIDDLVHAFEQRELPMSMYSGPVVLQQGTGSGEAKDEATLVLEACHEDEQEQLQVSMYSGPVVVQHEPDMTRVSGFE